MRRVILSALLAVAVAATVSATGAAQQVSNTNRQATLVMRGGDRHTGTLVYHNDANLNVIENGQDRAYPIDEVAVVELSGDPTSSELNQLPPADSSNDLQKHMLALRDGTVVHGRMYTIKPNAITMYTQSGHQDFDLGSVSRLYISPTASRQLFVSLLTASPSSTPAVATAGQAPAGAITVDATRPWTDTGITVRRGDRVAFSTTGQVAIRQGGDMLGPDGSPTENRTGAPTAALGVGGLIGRIGTGAPFPIGSNTQPLTMPAAGRLYLGVNDSGPTDNSGAFIVTIVR